MSRAALNCRFGGADVFLHFKGAVDIQFREAAQRAV